MLDKSAMFRSPTLVVMCFLFAGCSIQKRTLMPGYHVELIGTQNGVSKAVFPGDELAELEWAVAGSLPNELPAAELTRPALLHSKATHMAHTRSIGPVEIPVDSVQAVLADPVPWEEAFKEQKMFGKLAFLTFALGFFSPLLLAQNLSLSNVALLMNLFGLLALILFIVNRRKRKQVLEIKEANGVDTSGERWRPSRKAAVGAGVVAGAGWFWVAIMTALFAALASGIESFLTSFVRI